MSNNKITMRVVPASSATEFNVQFTVTLDDEADTLAVDVLTDGPLAELDGAEALGEIVEFTENIIRVLNEGRNALKDGSALNVEDTINTKD